MFPFSSEASLTTNLHYGSHGVHVRELQTFLIAQNLLGGPATGNFYNLTRTAVKEYQRKHNIPATGFVGPLTRAAINAEMGNLSTETSRPDAATNPSPTIDSLVAQIQQLNDLITALRTGVPAATSSITQTYATSSGTTAYNQSWSKSVVNLFCTSRYGGYESFSSGTGVIIDPRGVILTNAHVAFDSLFAHWPEPSLEECYVRTGSPASNAYTATLLYIPDAWARAQIANAFAPDATTTLGEDDYALLLITGTASGKGELPTSFPYLPIFGGMPLPVHTPVYLMGYAAENLATEMMLRSLYLLSTPAQVNAQRPLGNGTTPEVIAFSGPINSQHGASGGAVVTGDGQVSGLITFLDANYGNATNERVLNAITTHYILNDFAKDTGMSLSEYLTAGDLSAHLKTFTAEKAALYQNAFVQKLKDKGYLIPGTI